MVVMCSRQARCNVYPAIRFPVYRFVIARAIHEVVILITSLPWVALLSHQQCMSCAGTIIIIIIIIIIITAQKLLNGVEQVKQLLFFFAQSSLKKGDEAEMFDLTKVRGFSKCIVIS